MERLYTTVDEAQAAVLASLGLPEATAEMLEVPGLCVGYELKTMLNDPAASGVDCWEALAGMTDEMGFQLFHPELSDKVWFVVVPVGDKYRCWVTTTQDTATGQWI
jgi:hypothetical protein